MNDDFEKLAQRYGVSLPKTPDVDQVSHLLKRMRDSVETQESGGRQGIRNPRTDATGLFQVMPANIAPWTKKYVGRAMSQDEFIRDKDAQEKVFQGEMGSYLRQALKRTDNEDEAIRMGAAAWYGGPDDMHRYDDPKRFRPDEPSFREYTTSVLGRIKKTPQVPQIDFDKLSSRYLQGNEFSSLAERYGVAPTQPIVEGQKPLLRPGQPLGTDLPPTNPTGVPLQTGVTAPVAQPVQPPIQQQVQQPAPPVQGKRRLPQKRFVTGEPVISEVPESPANLQTGTFTRETANDAIADVIEMPDSVKTASQANEYVKGQLRAKYPNIQIPDNFTFAKKWTKGTGAVIDYATLKQMGVDTDALVSERIAQERVGQEQTPNLKMPVMPEAEAEKALDARIRSTDYAGQQRMAEFISNPANLILPIALWNSYNQQGDVLREDWVDSQKKKLIDQYGSYGKALQAEEYYKNSDWAETVSRMARQTAGSFAKNLFSGTAKSIATLGQEFEDANPLNLVLPDKAKIGVRNLVNGADFLTRLMTAPTAQDAVNEMEWASGNDISKQQLYRAAQEFDKAIGDDPVLKGRFLGSLADAGGSALAFVALGAVMPAMRTTNFWGKTRDWSTAIAGAVQSAGSGYEEGKGQGLSESDARKFGVIQGLLGTSEMVGAGAELTSFLKDPTLRRHIANALLEVGQGVKREAKQEFAQEVFQTTSGRVVLEYLKDNDPSTLQKLANALNKLPIQIAEAVTNEGITAAITGGLMGGAGTAAQVQSAETAEPVVQPLAPQTEVAPPVEQATLRTVEDIPLVGTDVEAGTKVRLKPKDVSIKPENIDTSTERVDTVNIPEQKPLTVIPDKQGKRQDRIEFKEPEAKPLATIPEKKGKRQDKVAFQNQKTAPLQTIPEKGNQKTVVLDSPKQERKKAPSVAELKQTEKGLDELYGKIDIAKDSTDYGYTSNQLAKIGALIDITPEGQKLTALKQREAEIQANHKIATKQYSQALKEREKVEKKAKAQWQNEAEKLTNDELIAKYNELFYPAMGNIVTRDELVRKEIEKRGLTDKIGQGVDPFKKLARTGEKAVNESSGIRWVLDRMVNADQVKGALDYAKSLTYEGEQYLPSNLLWDISQNKYADEATKKEARQLYDKAMGVVSTPREQLHAEKEKERAQRYAKKKITAPPKPAPVTPIQADDEVSWVQDGQTQTGIVQKVSGLSAVIEDAAGDTHRVLLTSLKRPDIIEFKPVPQKSQKAGQTPKRDRPSQPALAKEGKELPKPEKDNVIRDGDIINNGVKTGIYREIDGKKRVQFYGGTPTISNTTEYKEGKWEKGEGDLMESARPEFYSQLERTIEQKMPKKATAEQVRGIIKDTKQEERDWLGIDQWLDEHPTATKEEVLQFVRENNAKIEVVEKGKSVYQPQFDITQSEDTQGNPIWQVKLNGKFLTALKRERFPTEDDVQDYASRHYRDANIQETDDTKFSQYVLPGGENYREMLLTLPDKTFEHPVRVFNKATGATIERFPGGLAAERYIKERDPHFEILDYEDDGGKGEAFRSNHWSEPNILVHIRFDDRTVDGKKILHIAEIQSDALQLLRKLQAKLDSGESLTVSEQQQYNVLSEFPFKKSWHELALKKALRYAVENGYDAVSWDTGETQADRYDLSKQVESIFWNDYGHPTNKTVAIKTPSEELIRVVIGKEDGIVKKGTESQNVPSEWVGKRLDDVIGKDLAEQILSSDSGQLEGEGLKTDAPGMKGFYDKILPAFANKYTKKWGGKVEDRQLDWDEGNEPLEMRTSILSDGTYEVEWGSNTRSFETEREANAFVKEMNDLAGEQPQVHFLDITPAMRESVMQGQPMFAVRQSDVQANERSFDNAKKLDIEELLPLVNMKDIEHTDDGILEVNDIPAYELVRRTLATAMNASPDFNGVFTDPDQVNAFVNTAERLAGQADAVGQDGQKFRDLAKMVKQVAKTDGSVIFLLSKEALPHEIVHKTFYFTRDPNKTRENQIPTDQLEAMAQTPIFKHIQRALGWRSYKKKKLATQMEEATTHIVRGEWDVLNIDTEEQTRDAARLALAYLKAFAKQNAREGKSEDDILKILAKEITYAEEVQKYIQLEGVQAEREADVQSAEDSNVRPARRGTGETVSEKYRPSEEKRLSQTPISAREKADIPLKDDPYISASNATQQDFANTQLAKGLDKATDWFNSQVEDGNLNSGATGVVGLNLLNAYAQQGRYAEMDAVAEKLVPMIRSAAQSVQAMRILAKFNPEKALAYATMRKMARTGLPLTDREINRLTPKIENLNNAEIDKAAVETAITELQNALERANAEIADLEQAIKDAEKPTTETKESVTKKIPTKRELRSREELEKAIRKSYGTDLMESVRDDSRQDIVDLIALDILDYKTPAETLEHIEVLTGNALTQEEFASLQLEAWNSLRPPAISRSAEQQAKLDARTAHRRLAFQTRGQKQGPKKPNVFEREVLAQGTELGYTEQEITGAILLPQLRGDNARQQWYQAMGGHNPELFKRSFDLRQTVLKNIRDQRAQAKAEREGFTGSLGQFENELRHRDMALREARLQLQREYDKIERSTGEHLLYGVEEAVNLFKGLSAWGEVSYILRQGFIPLVTDTRAALKGDWQGVGHGLQGDNELWKWIGDKAGFDQAVQYLGDHSLSMFISKIRQHPRFLEAQNNGVRFTQIGDFNIADDHFSTKLLEAVPLYKRAEVAYTLPGDLQRLFIYDSWAKYIEGQNLSEVDERKAKKYAAETANAFTGKGNIAKLISREGALAKLASITFFSPQLLISRFQSAYRLSTGFATAPKGMRLQMAKKGARFYGLLALMLYIAGASLDPEDDDFGTLNVKKDSRLAKAIPDARDLHIDMLAGLDVPIQNGLRLFMGLGKAVMNNDRAYFNDAVLASWRQLGVNKQGEPRFLRSKLSPGASMIADWYTGKDYLGRPFSYWGAISSRVSPLAWQQTYDALLYDRLDAMKTEKQTPVTAREKLANERKWDNALVMLLGTFTGVGITQYPKDEKSKAMELASTLSDAVSKKDDETRRVEGVLRKLFKAQQEALVDGGNTSKVNAEINDWINKHPQLKSETKRLLGEAKSKTGLFSYYVKDLTLPELQRVQKIATGDELEVVNQMIKKVEKKKK